MYYLVYNKIRIAKYFIRRHLYGKEICLHP